MIMRQDSKAINTMYLSTLVRDTGLLITVLSMHGWYLRVGWDVMLQPLLGAVTSNVCLLTACRPQSACSHLAHLASCLAEGTMTSSPQSSKQHSRQPGLSSLKETQTKTLVVAKKRNISIKEAENIQSLAIPYCTGLVVPGTCGSGPQICRKFEAKLFSLPRQS